MALIPDFYKNAVVSIGIKSDSGATNWIGTGFLVVRRVDKDGYIPFLVSNKHVFPSTKILIFLQISFVYPKIIIKIGK